MKVRVEDFGAIVAIDDPPALLHVDPTMARALGAQGEARWASPRGWLSAPTEVHVLVTERCPAGCPSCYVGATPDGPERPKEEVMRALQRLADAGVFHVALGGGESILREDLWEIAAYARALGLVPNLTTSGMGMTARVAERCRVFGQVNVSLDGLGTVYQASRGYDGAAGALRALRLLAEAGVSCGANTVLCHRTLPGLPALLAALEKVGAHEVELLRYKPTGRGTRDYEERALHEAEARALLPTLLAMAQRHPSLNLKIDCSFVPFLCAADPPLELLERFGVIGCEAGNVLAAVRADLQATPCSFIEAPIGGVDVLVDAWDSDATLLRWRAYHEREAPEPCASCPYRTLCKGGCKAVSVHVHGDPFHPDPECPRVRAWNRGETFVAVPLTPNGGHPHARQ